ncbi:hypothetical protein HRbin28_02745 [bacterium HR28]|nr:hypothetical protein HRbin28_02745 [bacterium HR28]
MIGIDVGAHTLHIHDTDTGEVIKLPTPQAETYLRTKPPTTIVLEPTGHYGLAIAELAYLAGHQVLLATDNDTWALRRVVRRAHKTDRLDATMLSSLAQLANTAPDIVKHALTPYANVRPLFLARRSAYTARKLVTLAAAIQNRLRQHPDPELQELARTLKKLAEHYQQQTIEATPPDVIARLTTIPGVSAPLAALLWTYLGNAERFSSPNHAVSYVGLAPRNFPTSGATTRPPTRRRTAALLATHLHMYALRVAANPHKYDRFGQTYLRLRTKGGRIALHAVKRQLVRVAFALLRNKETYVSSQEAP